MEYKKIFLDTCVLSDIGRLEKKDRADLAYKFLVEDKLQIILTPHNLLEIEDMPDEQVKNNVYDFLDLSFVGYAKSYDVILQEEIDKYFSNENIDIVAFNLSYLQKDKDGKPFNFKTFKAELLKNAEFKNAYEEYNNIIIGLQNEERSLKSIDNFFKVIVFHRIYNLDKSFLKELNGDFIDYKKIPSFIVWAYSYASKIGSSGFKHNPKEMNDVSMSYIAPYVDILVTESKQFARYEEIKNKKLISSLNNVDIKKHNQVISKEDDKIKFKL